MARTPRPETLILDIETIPDVERWQRPEPALPPPVPEATPSPGPTETTLEAQKLEGSREPSTTKSEGSRTEVSGSRGEGSRGGDRRDRGDRDAFPPIWAHRVIVIGYMLLDPDNRLKRFGVIEGAAGGTADQRERSLLETFSQLVGKRRPLLVTYNGRSFDLPVIAMRSLCHAVPLGWYYRDRDLRARYSPEGHFDLCDWLADHGAIRAGKLDQLARLIGLPGKVGVDGSQVEGLYASGEIAAIEKYCLGDVAQTALLFLRFRLLQGALPVAAYRERVAALVGDARVTDVLDGIDHDRLLGPPAPPDPADAWLSA